MQLRLLDSPMDQFVEGSEIAELFDLSLSLAALNSCLVTRQDCFVVNVVFVHGRCWSGLPRILDGPIVLRLYNSRLVHRLCLNALEGDDLSLELVVKLPQHLMFINDIFAVESRLLSITI